MKQAEEFRKIIHWLQTNSGHHSKEHWGFERFRTIQDCRYCLELQLGQMLWTESAGDVVEEAIGEKRAVVFYWGNLPLVEHRDWQRHKKVVSIIEITLHAGPSAGCHSPWSLMQWGNTQFWVKLSVRASWHRVVHERETGLGLTQLELFGLWKRRRMEEAEGMEWLISLWVDTLILSNLVCIQTAVRQRAGQGRGLPWGQWASAHPQTHPRLLMEASDEIFSC